MAQIIPIQAVASQVLSVQLSNQDCTIKLYQTDPGLFIDLYVSEQLIIGGIICLNGNRIVRSNYLGFSGDLLFIDLVGNEDPEFVPGSTDLGTRFELVYVTPDEIGQAVTVGTTVGPPSPPSPPSPPPPSFGPLLFSVSNIAALRALDVALLSSSQALYVNGYYTDNDGGQGIFLSTIVNPGPDNGGTVIWSNAGNVYYLRDTGTVDSNVVNTAWFGSRSSATGTEFDNYEPIQRALNSLPPAHGGNGGVAIVPDGPHWHSQGFLVPPRCTLKGEVFVPSNPPLGTVLVCDVSVMNPVTLQGQVGLATNQTTGLRNISIAREGYLTGTGTIPADSNAVFVDRGYNIILEDVCVYRHAIGYKWLSYVPSGSGISSQAMRLYSGTITQSHIITDTFPEIDISHCRFGMNGSTDVNCNEFILVTGGYSFGASGPNGLRMMQCQFNQGIIPGSPPVFLRIANLTGEGITALQWFFNMCHIEGVSAGIVTDSTVSVLRSFDMYNVCFNEPDKPFFQLDAATAISEFYINNCTIYCDTFSMSPSGVDSSQIIGNRIFNASPSTLNLPDHSTINILGNSWANNITLTGGGSSSVISYVFNTQTAGVFTNSLAGLLNTIIDPIGYTFLPKKVFFADFGYAVEIIGGNPYVEYDSNDFSYFDRANNQHNIVIASSTALSFNPGGIVPVATTHNGSYTLVFADTNQTLIQSSGANTWTIPLNATVAFAIGTTIRLIDTGNNIITIARTGGVSLYKSTVGTNANQSVKAYGVASLTKVGTDSWVISGDVT